MNATITGLIDQHPAALLIPVVLVWAYWGSPMLRIPIHWVLKTAISEPAKFLARWVFWLARITLLAGLRLAKHLALPRKFFYPELGSPNETGTVRPGWKPLKIGGAADTWSLGGAVVAGLLRWTSAWTVAYPEAWQRTETSLAILSAAESTLIAWGVVWLGWRVWGARPHRNTLSSNLLIRSSDALNQRAEFRIGRRIDTGVPVYLPAHLLRYNVLGYGAPGSGKTTLAKLLMKQQIERGGGLLFVDAKLDSSDIKQIFFFARSAGRERDVLFINPGNPALSNTYNPIQSGDEDEIADRCLALIPAAERAGEDHYRESARRAIKTTIAALRALNLGFNFRDLSTILGSGEAMSKFCEDLLERAPNAPATADFLFLLNQYKTLRGNKEVIDVKRLQETYGGIAGRLATFGTGAFGAVTSAYSPEVTLFDAIRQNKIIYISLPSMGKAEASTNFAKILIADLRTALSWLQALPESERTLFLAFMDEAATYSMPAMQTMFSQNRSSGVSLIPLTQTPAQFVGEVSKEFADIIETGCRTKLFFQLADAAACERAATLVGQVTRTTKSLATIHSRGANTNKSSASPDGSDAGGSSQNIGEREEQNWRVPPEDFARLSTGEAILWTAGKDLVHLQVDLPPSAPPDLEITVQHPPTEPVQGVEFYEKFVLKRPGLDEIFAKAAADNSASGNIKGSHGKRGGGTSLDLYRE